MNRQATVKQAAELWVKELTDQTGRNQLLYYRELKAGTLGMDNARSHALNQFLQGRKIRAQKLFGEDSIDDAIRRLRAISRKARTNFEEKGISTLLLGWGMATWKPVSSSATPAAPILLCPVALVRTGAAELDFEIKLSGGWLPNEALLHHLHNEFRVVVSSEDLMRDVAEDGRISEREARVIFAKLSSCAARVPNFEISERVVLGNFMYRKMPMVRDIQNNIEALSQHDLIAAIAGDEEATQTVRTDQTSNVSWSQPDHILPENEFLVLDADSSQNAAINAALAGESFVLQGPPGTGKSQTISNLIAAMMAEGKSVLFVAEKRAAIDAVTKRLTKVGLDRFIMDLHGGLGSRKELARQLRESLDEFGYIPHKEDEELHRQLLHSRRELSGFAEALHEEPEPWGMSFFEVQSQLLEERNLGLSDGASPQAPLEFQPSVLAKINRERAQKIRSDLQDWVDLTDPLRSGRSPWTGAQISTRAEVESAWEACMGLAGDLTSNWKVQQESLSDELGIANSESIAKWGKVVAETLALAGGIADAKAAFTIEVFHKDLGKFVEDMAPATSCNLKEILDSPTIESCYRLVRETDSSDLKRVFDNPEIVSRYRFAKEIGNSGLGRVFNNPEIEELGSAASWAEVIAEVPDMASEAKGFESVFTIDIFNLDLDKLAQDIALGISSSLGELLDSLEMGKPWPAAKWAEVVVEIPDMALGVQRPEAVFTLEIFNQDLGKLVQDLAPGTGNGLGQLFSRLFNKRFRSALGELESLKVGVSKTNARTLYREVEAALTLTKRWTELGCPGSPEVLVNMKETTEEIAQVAQQYASALARLETLKSGVSRTSVRTLLDEVKAVRALIQRWSKFGLPGSPKVLARMKITIEEIAQIAKKYAKALSELEKLNPGVSETNAGVLFKEVKAARAINKRWSELGWLGTPKVLTNAGAASEAYEKMRCALDDPSHLLPERKFATISAEEITRAAKDLLDDQHTLNRFPRLAEIEKQLRDIHVGPLLDKVNSNSLPAEHLVSAFDHSWLQSIYWELLQRNKCLSAFQGRRQSRLVNEFQQSDHAHLEGTSNRVTRKIVQRAESSLAKVPMQDRLIRKEANKKTRHMPLRRLFDQASTALTSILPCWAMSPLDVAQTLPAEPLFDMVVFDEASQVLPCDAISALLRGKRAMVAGDSRQLPPTTFFDISGGDSDLDEAEESLGDYESILDVLDSKISRRSLNWHYRSQDEGLIAFSNKEIYQGSLTTFPGANADQCLGWELVPHRQGVATEKGSSSDEVLRVVELMIEHARQRPYESLGVIAMGLHHASRIEEVLRRRMNDENGPELEEFFSESREERAFVKNLERVQGDERDAIILSIGYGKNANGKMQYRFGPLNQEGGERRLNVAVTRARKRMTVVSSFDFTDMDPERIRPKGVKLLRGFLKFAQSGGTELDGADEQTPQNYFEMNVFDKLRAAGLDVVPQYGSSGYRIDFAVRHPTAPGQFVLAVEADGASYHSSHTVRDRDRLRQEHLERLGWRFCRI